MFKLTKEKINLLLNENKLRFTSIKICLIYLICGFAWIYISERITHLFFSRGDKLLTANVYKGFIFIVVTTFILYYLMKKFLKIIFLRERELKNSNMVLQAYIKKLASSKEELRIQYDKIYKDEQRLIKSEEKNRAIIQAMPDVLFIINRDGIFLDCEANADELLVRRKLYIGKTLAETMPKEIAEIAYENLKLVFETGSLRSFEYKLSDEGIVKYYEFRMVKKGENEILAIVRNITRRKELEINLEYLSYNDQLTGVKSRRFYEEELKRLDVKENLPLTIVLGDANGLKLINDSFGHIAGDELIHKIAEIIEKECRPNDVVARLGGDEFVILLPNTDTDETEKIIKSINKSALKEKVQNLDVSISFGYETKRYEEEDIQDIFRKAENYMYKRKLFESSCTRGKTIETIINTLNEKNKREEQHSVRVSELCKKMGEVLELPERKIHELKTAGLLHDIGKIAIEESILNKTGKLDNEEFKEIKRHPEIGYRILSTVNELSEIAEYVLLHHEKWNGEGYPKKLKGEEIPLESRIIAIADVYDAIISDRSYRKALSKEFAIEEIKRNADIQFDPRLVNVFIDKVLVPVGIIQ